MTANATPSSPHPTDHRCTGCGYGIAKSSPPDRCPMCGRDRDTWAASQVVGLA